jgi:hypothetical protein
MRMEIVWYTLSIERRPENKKKEKTLEMAQTMHENGSRVKEECLGVAC